MYQPAIVSLSTENCTPPLLFVCCSCSGADSIYVYLNLCLPFRVAGNASFLLGAILEDVDGKKKVIEMLLDEHKSEDKGYLIPSLTALIQTHELEAMTNASGTMSLLVRIATYPIPISL